MNQKNHAPLNLLRTGAALFGIAGMLALSACSPEQDTEVKPSDTISSASQEPSEEAPTSEPQASESTDSGTDSPSYSTGSYPIPMDGSTTSVGEPVRDAENRFVTGVKKRLGDFAPDSKVLEMGYETCGFYLHSDTQSELFDKIKEVSKGDKDAEIHYVYISGAAANTLCPEYTKFNDKK